MTEVAVFAARSAGRCPHVTFDPPSGTPLEEVTTHRVAVPPGCGWVGDGRSRLLRRPDGWLLAAYGVLALARHERRGFRLASETGGSSPHVEEWGAISEAMTPVCDRGMGATTKKRGET